MNLVNGHHYESTMLPDGTRPDIAIWGWPGQLAELANDGRLVNLATYLDQTALRKQLGDRTVESATMRDGLYWLPLTAGLLGIVWYRTSAFTSAGYQAPTSWNELTALTRRMIADGQTPWCIATNDPPSPGWAITDWLEALVLRTGGAELYDRWARHEVPFDDEAVRRAGRLLDDILFTPGSVLGGPADVIKKPGVQAIDAMAQNPPACLMSEGGDVTDYVGEADDYDYFVLPPVDPSIEPSTVLWGVEAGVLSDRPEVRELVRFFSQPNWGIEGAGRSGDRFTPIRRTLSVPQCVNRDASLLTNARRVRVCQEVRAALDSGNWRFEASGLMPPAMRQAFEAGMTEYVESGAGSLDHILADLDRAWPTP